MRYLSPFPYIQQLEPKPLASSSSPPLTTSSTASQEQHQPIKMSSHRSDDDLSDVAQHSHNGTSTPVAFIDTMTASPAMNGDVDSPGQSVIDGDNPVCFV
jgi:hypothetical protein